MSKTSLAKSHSVVSNFKLTSICLLASTSVSLLWIGISFFKKYNSLGICLIIVGALLTLISIVLINKFTR